MKRILRWVTQAFRRRTSLMQAGWNTFGSATCSYGEYRTGNAFYLVSRYRDVVSWTSQTVCSRARQALWAYKEMRKSKVKPSSYILCAALKACGSLHDLKSAKQIHAEVIEWGAEPDLFVGTMLVDAYCKCGSMVDARQVFEKMSQHDVISWNAIILGYAQVEDGEQALQMYARMGQESVVPNDRTFVSALKACSSLATLENANIADGILVKQQSLEKARAIHLHLLKNGYESDVFVGTMLVDVYSKCGSLVDARQVFESMPHRDVVSWNAMIWGYAQLEHGEEALQLYTMMRQRKVSPDDRTYVGVLKACSSLKWLEEGNKVNGIMVKERSLEHVRTIHAHIAKCDLESNIFIGNTLVDVYSKCGSLVDARGVFEKMAHRDVVSWTAMILGYSQMNNSEAALQMYVQMQHEGVRPNRGTFIAALKACSSLVASKEGDEGARSLVRTRCLEQVRAIHSQISNSGFNSAVFLQTMLVDLYAKCGSPGDARSVFENIIQRDVISWNTMIMGYAQMEQADEALHVFALMQQEGIEPDKQTFVSALKACNSLATLEGGNEVEKKVLKERSLEQVRAVHLHAVKRGYELDSCVGNMLVDSYAKCGSLADAKSVFNKLPLRDVFSWNAMIFGCGLAADGQEAFGLYAVMQQEGVSPDDRTFVGVLKACSTLAGLKDENQLNHNNIRNQCLDQVKAIHCEVVLRHGLTLPVFVGTMLVDIYVKYGRLLDARVVFDKMPQRDVVSWNAIIFGYTQFEEGEEALRLYAEMRHEGVLPDDRTFVSVLKACSSLAGLEGERGSKVVKSRCLLRVQAIHSDIVSTKYVTDVFVGTVLVDSFAKSGSLMEARSVFEKMPHRNVVSWNAIILGYAEMKKGEEALKLYARMLQEGVVPDDRTFVGALKACSGLAELMKGKEIHRQISESGVYICNSYVVSSLIDMYGKCGSMTDAEQVFGALVSRDVVTWNALIAGYARQGSGERVFDSFEQMCADGIQPDGITFLSVLSACNHVGLVDRGGNYFKAMYRDYGITPSIEHYNCMVDMLGRGGQIHKAMEVVRTMPFEPNGEVWRSLLSACQKWNNVHLGRQAFDFAVRLDNKDPAAYSLMYNIYLAAGMREHAKEIQAMRTKAQAHKQPGQSWWTDLGGDVHEFLVGDRRPQEG